MMDYFIPIVAVLFTVICVFVGLLLYETCKSKASIGDKVGVALMLLIVVYFTLRLVMDCFGH